ncbi:hypothetical protein V3C99_002965 [Haemonchus contortus]
MKLVRLSNGAELRQRLLFLLAPSIVMSFDQKRNDQISSFWKHPKRSERVKDDCKSIGPSTNH